MSTRAATKMEEQMAALMTKLDKQNEHLREQTEQLQLLVRQQVERIDDIASRQVRTDERVDALDGELQSAKQSSGRTDKSYRRIIVRIEESC